MHDDLRLLAEFLEILNKRSTRVSAISSWDRSQHWSMMISPTGAKKGPALASGPDKGSSRYQSERPAGIASFIGLGARDAEQQPIQRREDDYR